MTPEQLQAHLSAFLASGGKIDQVPRGISGYTEEGKKWCKDRFSINRHDRKKRFEK
jgi:hypothetical protein